MTSRPSGWVLYWNGLFVARAARSREHALAERLQRVRRFVEEHAEQPLDLAAMARAAHVSKFHFLRSFREVYGQTPSRYLAEVRLSRARRLLETTEWSVTEICFAVGYESLPSFCLAFRRATGVPPERYRRRWVAVPGRVRAARVPVCVLAMYGDTRLRQGA